MMIYLLRHTRVDVSPGLCYGQTDVPMASSYEQEKKEVMERLADVHFRQIYSSPLLRCFQLATAIAGEQCVVSDDRLMELNFGMWEQLPWTTFEKGPEAVGWFANYLELPCPGGESYTDLLHRVDSFYKELPVLPQNENILVVTHGGVIRVLMAIIQGMPTEKLFDSKVDFGSITKLQTNG